MRRHPVVGAEILLAVSDRLGPVADAVRSHHERWDGTGYPDGRAGSAIPLYGRILAVVDVFDAVTSPRHYRARCLDELEARALLVAESGTHFDADVVRAYLSVRMVHDLSLAAEQPHSRPSAWTFGPVLVDP